MFAGLRCVPRHHATFHNQTNLEGVRMPFPNKHFFPNPAIIGSTCINMSRYGEMTLHVRAIWDLIAPVTSSPCR